MKTFLAVTIYAALVAALDLGGAVWTYLHSGHAAQAVAATAPAKAQSATRRVGTIPSDT